MITISIIMPVYNAENFLNKSIGSVQKQTLKNIEIVCVDDGSEDNSLDVLENLRDKYGNIKIISQENAGPGIARNTGIKNANGEYIAFLDSDDIFLDFEALEKMYEVGKNENADLVAANLRWINQDYTLDQYYDFLDSRFTYFTKSDMVKSEDYGIPFAFYKNIFKRTFLLEHNIDFPDLRFGEDPVFMINVLANIQKFPTVPLDLYGYNHSIGGGLNNKITDYDKKYSYIQHFKDIFDILKENGFYSILSTYKNEFIDYLIFSSNICDDEIKEILFEVFNNYEDYFAKDEYGYFIIDYILNNENPINLEEFNQIKKYLLEESSIDFNFIDLNILKEYFNFISENDINLNDSNVKKSSFNELVNINRRIFENEEFLEEEIEDLENEINAPIFNKNGEYLRKFVESRIDIKNFGDEDNSIEIIDCTDSTVDITHPSWFNDDEGLGTIISAVNNNLDFSIKCIKDGNLQIGFKGIDYKDKKSNRIPIYIDYTNIFINDEVIVDGSRVSWHDNPLIYEKEVEDGEVLNIHVEWSPFTQDSNIYLMPENEKVVNNFYKSRIDIKNSGDESNKLVLVDSDDPASNIYEPMWLNDETGIGFVVYSTKGSIDVSFKCINDGDLDINFKSFDFRDENNNKIPIFIDYTEIIINGKYIHKGSYVAWHDNSFDYSDKVKDGDIINIKAKWRPLSSMSNLKLLSGSGNQLNKYSTSRIDIKNYGKEDNDIVISSSNDSLLKVSHPNWFNDKRGKGSILTSVNKNLNFSLKCVNDGFLEIGFRSLDFRDKHNRKIPIYLDYTDIIIDGEKLIDGSTVLWHDNQLIYKKEVKDGQIIKVRAKWKVLNGDTDCNNIFEFNEKKEDEIEKLEYELERLKGENKELKELKEDILNSRSWQFTEFLRQLKN